MKTQTPGSSWLRALFAAGALLLACQTALASPPQDDKATVTQVWGINSTWAKAKGNWIEAFEITVHPDTKPPSATAKLVAECQEPYMKSLGKGILVTGDSVGNATIYYTIVKSDLIYETNFGCAQKVNTYEMKPGFFDGIGDIAGKPGDLWLNPFNNTHRAGHFEGKKPVVFYGLKNAGKQYDGFKVFGAMSIANREDANYPQCSKSRRSFYDIYNIVDAGKKEYLNPKTEGFITTDFRASGVNFDGTYFFVSDICGNEKAKFGGIAVYEKDGAKTKFLAEAPLPKPTATRCDDKLERCLEDLSIGHVKILGAVESSPLSERQASVLVGQRAEATLAAAGPDLNHVRVGVATSITARVGVVGATVIFTRMLGDVRFTSGELARDGKQSTLITDESGQATLKFIAQQPGLSIIQAAAQGATLNFYVNATLQ